MTNRIKNAHGRIAAKFAELRARDEAALIPYIVAGDPNLDRTAELVLKLEARGADLIELCVPFSGLQLVKDFHLASWPPSIIYPAASDGALL